MVATRERVPSVTWRATANGAVIDYRALGVQAAGARARVRAFLVYASLILRALRTDHAFRPATRRTSNEFRQAGANGLFVHLAALTVRAARRRLTRVTFGGLL